MVAWPWPLGSARRVALPCRNAVAASALGGGLVVLGDDDGAHWSLDGRLLARDWRLSADGGDGPRRRGPLGAGEAVDVTVSRG